MTIKPKIVGSTEYVSVAGVKHIPAKIDTGADSSSIWASSINMTEDGILEFVLFDQKSPLYTGERLHSQDYQVKTVRSSHGDEQIRYRVKLPLTIGDETYETAFTLANRSHNNFPVLIGRHTLDGHFLVDVSRRAVEGESNPKTPKLNRDLTNDPYRFHQKYIKERSES